MAILLGTLDSDIINGTEFADVVTALSGSDRVLGRAGADLIEGGTGDDRLYANDFTTWYDGAIDTILAGDGDDQVFGAFGDVLTGGIGIDSLSIDLSQADAGLDLDFRPEGLDLLGGLLGEGPVIGIGNGSVGGFEIVRHLIGTDFDDSVIVANRDNVSARLEGGAGNDDLRSGGGNDRIDGGTGADRMAGGRGNDFYYVDTAADIVVEQADSGYDRLYSSVDRALGANFEALYLTGRAANGTGNDLANLVVGNALDNRLIGNDGRDQLRGGGGADSLIGGADRDFLLGGQGADRFVFGEDAGSTAQLADVVQDFARGQGDRLDFSRIDAVDGGGDDAFTFVGNAAFSGEAGELRFVVGRDALLVQGDTDGNGLADVIVRINNAEALIATDFIL